MSNPILQNLSRGQAANLNPQLLQKTKQLMNAVRFAANPKHAMDQIIAQNPQMNDVIQMLNGRNPKDVFYEECEKHNIDPESVLSQLR